MSAVVAPWRERAGSPWCERVASAWRERAKAPGNDQATAATVGARTPSVEVAS